jgi:hypothetical protein
MDQNEVLELKNINADTEPEQKLRDLVKHLQEQMNNRYTYLVGEWANGYHARSTRNGQFVKSDEVIDYLRTKQSDK